MLFTVTRQEASTVEDTHIFERQASRCRVGAHDRGIEIDQMAVTDSGPLSGANTVWIVTS